MHKQHFEFWIIFRQFSFQANDMGCTDDHDIIGFLGVQSLGRDVFGHTMIPLIPIAPNLILQMTRAVFYIQGSP